MCKQTPAAGCPNNRHVGGRDVSTARPVSKASLPSAARALKDNVSVVALLATLTTGFALGNSPTWADGGTGTSESGSPGGVGGTDGSLASATGQNGTHDDSGTAISTGAGGGGAVDLATGNGAPGGAVGTYGTGTVAPGAAGATGTTGLIAAAPTSISTAVGGGAGGAAEAFVANVNTLGGGGGGGVGVSATSDVTITGTGSVIGGSGTMTRIGGTEAGSGSGGGGGVGVFSAADVTVDAGGQIAGGAGGSTTIAGAGEGAAAIVLTNGGIVQNSGALIGGAGGGAKAAGGGDGGAGVQFLAGGTVINAAGGTITGGNGGGGLARSATPPTSPGHGGAGIEGADLSIVNAGTITGGTGGSAAIGQADAIQFTGGVNSLEIQAGSTITGNVVAYSTADTFKLGGDTDASFDVSQIGAGAQYQGFGIYEKTGTSTWTLTGTTASVTPWTLAGGILQISSDSNLGDPSSGLTFNGGTLEITADITSARTITLAGNGTVQSDAGTTLSLEGAISGTGNLTKTGTGALILTANDTYTGGTTITAGTLQLGSGGTSGSIVGDVVNNGTLAFNRSDAVTFAGVISGTGAVSQLGAGTTTLSGINTYSGGTTITAGTLSGSASSFGSGAILDNSALVIDQPTDAMLATALNGSGSLTKQGAGLLTYTGIGSLSGPTTVAAGTLSVTGALAQSAVTVQSGATLGGTGTVGATRILTGATIAPSSLGTLHINGAYAQAAGSTYQVELDPNSTASDRIAVTGAATLANGAVLNVTKTATANYQLGTQYTVLTATNGVSGTYTLPADYDSSLSAFLGLKETADANDIYLKVVQTQSLAAAAQTPNQSAAAGGLQSVPAGNPVATAVLNSPNDAAARSAFNLLSGEAQAALKGVLISGSLLVRDTTLDRLRQVFCTTAPATSAASAGAAQGGTAADGARAGELPATSRCDTNPDHLTLWGQGLGDWGHADGSNGSAAIDHSTGGFLMGADLPLDAWRAGLFGGYSHTDFSVDDRNSSGDSDSYHLGLYGGTQLGNLELRLGAGYTWNDVDTERLVTAGALSNLLRAAYSADTAQAFGELGYRLTAGALTVEPFANLANVSLHTEHFSESGGPAALSSQADTTDNTFSTLGIRPAANVAFGSVRAAVRAMLGWRHTFGELTPSSTVAFAGGSPFTVDGAPLAKDTAVAELGLDLALSPHSTLSLTYAGQLSGASLDQSVRGEFAFRF